MDAGRGRLLGWLLLCLACHQARPERLLLLPLPASSHVRAMVALSTELEARGGHDIHMAVPDTLLAAAQSQAAALHPGHAHTFHTFPSDEQRNSNLTSRISSSSTLPGLVVALQHVAALSGDLLGNTPLLAHLAGLQPDLVIQDSSLLQAPGCLLQTPAVDFDVGTGGVLLHSNVYGCQFHPGYLPAPGTFLPSTGMTLPQRVVNTAAAAASKVLTWWLARWGPLAQLQGRLGLRAGRLAGCQPLLLLVNYDWALEPPRPISPMVRYLGPLLPRPPGPLPPHLLDWLEGGIPQQQDQQQQQLPPVVVISFGSSLNAPAAALHTIGAAVVACLTDPSQPPHSNRSSRVPPMRFLVRLRPGEVDPFHAGITAARGAPDPLPPSQLLVLDQLPQNDLLGHPAVGAFVTQGGYLSSAEAAYHGVPLAGVPLILGQGDIMAAAVDQGRGLLVHKQQLLRGDPSGLVAALTTLLTQPSYKAAAQRVAARLAASPPPGQLAAQQVRYALDIRDQPPFLQTKGVELAWWQVLLLDVLAVYLVGVVAGGRALLGAAVRRGRCRVGGAGELSGSKAKEQ